VKKNYGQNPPPCETPSGVGTGAHFLVPVLARGGLTLLIYGFKIVSNADTTKS